MLRRLVSRFIVVFLQCAASLSHAIGAAPVLQTGDLSF
jgi:hypothetical protein